MEQPTPNGTPRTRRLALFSLAAAFFIHHAAVWAYVTAKQNVPLGVLLDRWDASLYSEIARLGYSGNLFAFLPLYPLSVRTIAQALNALATPQFIGSAFSTALFVGFALACEHARGDQAGLKPRTIWGWAVFLFSPASYVFHSHHTESLFLLLSFASLYWAATDHPFRAGLAAGLSSLTRNQGLFVALAVWLFAILRSRPGERLRRSALAVLPVMLAVGCLLVFQKVASGDALASFHVQRSWSHADSIHSALASFWFGNAWQYPDAYSWGSLAFFVAMGAAAIPLARKSPPLTLYVALSLLIQLAQGELVHAFRYGAVLFSPLFTAGDWLARMPRLVRFGVLALLIVVNHSVTRRYALGQWAY